MVEISFFIHSSVTLIFCNLLKDLLPVRHLYPNATGWKIARFGSRKSTTSEVRKFWLALTVYEMVQKYFLKFHYLSFIFNKKCWNGEKLVKIVLEKSSHPQLRAVHNEGSPSILLPWDAPTAFRISQANFPHAKVYLEKFCLSKSHYYISRIFDLTKVNQVKIYCSYFELIVVHKTFLLGWDLHFTITISWSGSATIFTGRL